MPWLVTSGPDTSGPNGRQSAALSARRSPRSQRYKVDEGRAGLDWRHNLHLGRAVERVGHRTVRLNRRQKENRRLNVGLCLNKVPIVVGAQLSDRFGTGEKSGGRWYDSRDNCGSNTAIAAISVGRRELVQQQLLWPRLSCGTF